MKSTMTIEQLAEKLNVKVWEKGGLKRIYLNDAGWNTKKMKTSTYIFKNEESEFVVVCKIECPSQGWGWISSQQNEVKESVYSQISEAIASIGETIEEVELPISEEITEMVKLAPVKIIENEHYNPRLTSVTHVVNLGESPMIDFYHGCGKGVAYVRDNQVVAFQYGYTKFANAPEACKQINVQFSCTQICFEL